MTFSGSASTHGRRALRPTPVPPTLRVLIRRHRVAEAGAVLVLVAALSIAPTARAQAAEADPVQASGQTVAPAGDVTASVERGEFGASSAQQTIISGSTNADWAKLVLSFGGWPITDENVNVMLRWMRQENGPQDWWNRNNPLNLGAGGFAAWPDLVTTAHQVANNLRNNGSYAGISSALAKGTSADATAAAIWASPWSGSHYANGTHWSTAPVEIVKAPSSAW